MLGAFSDEEPASECDVSRLERAGRRAQVRFGDWERMGCRSGRDLRRADTGRAADELGRTGKGASVRGDGVAAGRDGEAVSSESIIVRKKPCWADGSRASLAWRCRSVVLEDDPPPGEARPGDPGGWAFGGVVGPTWSGLIGFRLRVATVEGVEGRLADCLDAGERDEDDEDDGREDEGEKDEDEDDNNDEDDEDVAEDDHSESREVLTDEGSDDEDDDEHESEGPSSLGDAKESVSARRGLGWAGSTWTADASRPAIVNEARCQPRRRLPDEGGAWARPESAFGDGESDDGRAPEAKGLSAASGDGEAGGDGDGGLVSRRPGRILGRACSLAGRSVTTADQAEPRLRDLKPAGVDAGRERAGRIVAPR